MRDVVRRAYQQVPHYKARFDAAGVHPDDLRQLEDLTQFPFTTKEDLRQNYPFGMFAVPMEQIVRIHASSGTTGKPTVVGYTRNDIETWSQLMARSIRAAGGRASDKIHVAYGYGLFTGGLGAHYGGEYLGAAVIPVSGGFTERQVQIINDFKPDIIMVTPSYMLAIADEFDRQGIDAHDLQPAPGYFRRRTMGRGHARRTRTPPGPGGAGHLRPVGGHGTRHRAGMRGFERRPDDLGGSFLPRDHRSRHRRRLLPTGEAGELVLTTLTKEGMPVIRYRTRDLTRLLPPTTRAMRRIDRISGRSDDMLIIRGVNVFPSNIEAVLAKEARLAPHYLLELRRPGSLDELDVVVETRAALAGKLEQCRIDGAGTAGRTPDQDLRRA